MAAGQVTFAIKEIKRHILSTKGTWEKQMIKTQASHIPYILPIKDRYSLDPACVKTMGMQKLKFQLLLSTQ